MATLPPCDDGSSPPEPQGDTPPSPESDDSVVMTESFPSGVESASGTESAGANTNDLALTGHEAALAQAVAVPVETY